MAKRNYTNGEITVLWDSDKCTHCEACWRGLPSVFNPELKPWVNINAAESEEIIRQVEKCPSGALLIDTTKQETARDRAIERGDMLRDYAKDNRE